MNSFMDALSVIASKKFPQHGRKTYFCFHFLFRALDCLLCLPNPEPRKAFTYLLVQYVFRNKKLARAMTSKSPTQHSRFAYLQALVGPMNGSVAHLRVLFVDSGICRRWCRHNTNKTLPSLRLKRLTLTRPKTTKKLVPSPASRTRISPRDPHLWCH